MAELNGYTGVWRTVGGRRIFIKDGQDLASAMKESGKFPSAKVKNNVENLKTLEQQIEFISKNQDELFEIVENSDNYDKDLCLYLQERNGFNGKPKVLSSDEFDNLSDEDYIKVYRGYHNGDKTAEEYIEQFKYGKNEYGNGGIQYGVGHYTIDDKSSAQAYGKVIEIAIPKTAKIIEHNGLLEQHYTNFEKYNNDLEFYYDNYGDKVTSVLDCLNSNESATAVLSNYDIVKKNNMYIVLNRSIIIVKEDD